MDYFTKDQTINGSRNYSTKRLKKFNQDDVYKTENMADAFDINEKN